MLFLHTTGHLSAPAFPLTHLHEYGTNVERGYATNFLSSL